jgi:hypothetical protein
LRVPPLKPTAPEQFRDAVRIGQFSTLPLVDAEDPDNDLSVILCDACC